MIRKKSRRKLMNYLINSRFQLKMVLLNLFYMLLIILTTLAVMLSPVIWDMFYPSNLDAQYMAAQTFLLLMKRLIPAVIILFPLIFIHQILITHRIFGPLVNFSNTFKQIGKGDFSRKIQLRKRDYLKKEGNDINEMLGSIQHFVANMRPDIDKLLALSDEIMSSVEDQEIKDKVAESQAILKKGESLIKNNLEILNTEGSQ